MSSFIQHCEDIMDRDSFIQVLQGCIGSATGRRYPNIDWKKMSDQGLIESAELVRDLLEKRLQMLDKMLTAPEPRDGNVH
jgi:hypothetical protein